MLFRSDIRLREVKEARDAALKLQDLDIKARQLELEKLRIAATSEDKTRALKAQATMDAFKHMTQINHDDRQERRDRAMTLLEHEDTMKADALTAQQDREHQKELARIAAQRAAKQAKKQARQEPKK